LTHPPSLARLGRCELRRASPTYLTYATYLTYLTHLTYATYLTYLTYLTYATSLTHPPSLTRIGRCDYGGHARPT
jgi:hypothetical protein